MSTKQNAVNRVSRDTHIERPRIHHLLEEAMNYPLVIVCAGSGYGKTLAVSSFLENFDAQKLWVQITTHDNCQTRYWENYIGAISQIWPEIVPPITEIGFPDTNEAFAKFCTLMNEDADSQGRQVTVFDDFHLLSNPNVIHVIERVVSMLPAKSKMVLISRVMPEVNMIKMLMDKSAFIIKESDLFFNQDEINDYFNQLSIPVTRRDIQEVYDDTQGWAFAIDLIGHFLKREQKYERSVVKAIKSNIFRHIEAEVSQTISDKLWRFLLRISLITHLAASLIHILADDNSLIKEMDSLHSFIRYDFHQDAYVIHHLFLAFLSQNQHLLSNEEKCNIYQKSGEWCEAHGYNMDAISYYDKSGDYYAIARIVASYSVQIPLDMAKCALEILDRAPDDIQETNTIFPTMYLRLKINLGQYDEAAILAQNYAADYESRPESPERNRALTQIYANWATLRMYMCTYTDVFDFDKYFEKMGEYFDKSPFQILGAYNAIVAWASLVGTNNTKAQNEYVNALSRSIPYTSRVANGILVGFDDLARGELSFYRGDFSDAERHLHWVLEKAHNQYITQNRALVYLMKINFLKGNLSSAKDILLEMDTRLSEEKYDIRYTMYDIAHGFYNLMLSKPQQIANWLKEDFLHYAHPASIENYGNRVKALYHYQTGRYASLLAYIDCVRQTILFDKIELLVLKALSLFKLKRHEDAFSTLTEAYQQANDIITPFLLYPDDMRKLASSAILNNCEVPIEWLKELNRKTSAYERQKNKGGNEPSMLTKREIAILKSRTQGVYLSEIAENMNVSLHTVKKDNRIMFEKLGVNTLAEAVRTAIALELI